MRPVQLEILAYLLLTGRKAFDPGEQPDGLGLHAYLTQERPAAGLGPEVDQVPARMLALTPPAASGACARRTPHS